jgi:hypothetical protein
LCAINTTPAQDALFAYAEGKEGCGYHVDDKYFWPAEVIFPSIVAMVQRVCKLSACRVAVFALQQQLLQNCSDEVAALCERFSVYKYTCIGDSDKLN